MGLLSSTSPRRGIARPIVGQLPRWPLARRLLLLLGVLLIDSFLTLALLDLAPGGPAYAILGNQASPGEVSLVNHQLGLDRPLIVRYLDWLGHILHGDFGTSLVSHQPVLEQIWSSLPASIEIEFLGLALALCLAVPLAMYTAYRVDGVADRVAGAGASLLISAPQFLTGLLLVFAFGVSLRVFPVTGWAPLSDGLIANLRYAILPSITLALSQVPSFMRVLRAEMVDTLQQDYILAARSRGLSTARILLRHALRPSSLSLVTLVGLSIGQLISADVIVEVLFGIPGVGQLLFQTVGARDFITLQGVGMFLVIIVVIVNALTDAAYTRLNPRIRGEH